MTNTMWIICLQVLLNGFFFEMSEAQTSLSSFAGDTVELSCPLSGTFTFPVWRGPPSSTKYTIQGDVTGTISTAAVASGRLEYKSDNKTLILSTAMKNDSGSYSCSYGGIGSHTITLTVTEKSTTSTTLSTSTFTTNTNMTNTAASTNPSTTNVSTVKSPVKDESMIIGFSIGGVIILFVIISFIICLWARKNREKKKKKYVKPEVIASVDTVTDHIQGRQTNEAFELKL